MHCDHVDKLHRKEVNANHQYCQQMLKQQKNATIKQETNGISLSMCQIRKECFITEQPNKWTKIIPIPTMIFSCF
jgi:hypothetical protein